MGRTLTRIARETPGLEIAGGLEAENSPHLGADLGELAGIGHIDAKQFHLGVAKIRDVQFVAKVSLACDGHGRRRDRNLHVDGLTQPRPRSVGQDERHRQHRDE